jgi:hypothetical protein
MWTSDPTADGATRMRTWATPSGPNEASSMILAGRLAARTVVLSVTAAGPAPSGAATCPKQASCGWTHGQGLAAGWAPTGPDPLVEMVAEQRRHQVV